ncbi:MAG: hypothetical protein QOE06_510 [Thermoleophilaceae bacterium]|jgi:hypothetical protein|nr:hypothetical protein [Thermoleophilaceae bacterium]
MNIQPRKTLAATGAALLAAMGLGGAAIAASNGTPPAKAPSAVVQSSEKPGVESNAPENSATDPDNVQYTAPGDPDAKSGSSSAKATLSSPSTAAATQTPEAPGTEAPAASEAPGAAEAPGAETAAGNDGPGGHADEPGNPNADHQFQGAE